MFHQARQPATSAQRVRCTGHSGSHDRISGCPVQRTRFDGNPDSNLPKWIVRFRV